MTNLDKELLIADKLNTLVLNREDLLDEVFIFLKNNSNLSKENIELINKLSSDDVFLESSIRCVYEATTLAVNSLFLDKSYSFIKIVEEFLYTYSELSQGIKCVDCKEDAISLFRNLRCEVYSRVISKNKMFKNSTLFDSELILLRKDEFFNYVNNQI